MGLFVDAHDAENDVLLEANAAIDLMKKKGATEADCKDLAKTSCEEVEKERANDQRLINKQKTGRHCVNLGQGQPSNQIGNCVERPHQRSMEDGGSHEDGCCQDGQKVLLRYQEQLLPYLQDHHKNHTHCSSE